jgi:hypothetical protein
VKTPKLAVVCLLASLVPALAEPPPAPKPDEVRYANDKVTVHVRSMAADALVAEIAKQADAKVTGTVERTGSLSLDWTDLPVKEALQHILGTQNFTLTYGEEGALRAIQLKGGQVEDAAAPPTEERPTTDAETALFKVFDIRDQVPIEGAIAKRLGKPTAPWDLLTNTGIGDDDPAVRRAAVKDGMDAFEENEPMRQAVVNAIGGMSDAQLAAFARAYMYHRAEDFVRNVKRETTLPDFRARSSAVLRELRKIPFKGPIPVEGGGSKNNE